MAKKVLFWVHGISKKGSMHGQQLEKQTAECGWDFVRITAHGTAMFSSGIELLAIRVATEIEEYHARAPVDHLSIVGASLGGLLTRDAMKRLQGKPSFANVQFILFATLATPHLGVAGRLMARYWWGGVARYAAAYTRIGNDLLWNTPVLATWTSPDHCSAIGSFRMAVAYAPLVDDNIVEFSSASILSSLEAINESDRDEEVVWELTGTATELVSAPDREVRAAEALRAAAPWRFFAVRSSHKRIATLYPEPTSYGVTDTGVASSVVSHLLALLEDAGAANASA